jgi:excisionase family DNA binding protein
MATEQRQRLSVAQVAATWQCSPKHVYNLINRGELRAIKLGELVRLRPEDVEAYECRDLAPKSHPIASNDEAIPIPSAGGMETGPAGFRAGLRISGKRNAS